VSERYLANAHVVVACAEDSKSLEDTVSLVGESSTAPILAVRTKADLVSIRDEYVPSGDVISVSAETGSGLQELLAAIDDSLNTQHGEIVADVPILTRARHGKAIITARLELEGFR